MATIVFEDISLLKTVVEMIKHSGKDIVPIRITKTNLEIDMFNIHQSVYFSFNMKKEYFQSFSCSKPISFILPGYFFANLITNVCDSTNTLTMEVKTKKVYFTYKNVVISTVLRLNEEEMVLRRPQNTGNCRLTIDSSEMIKAIKTIGILEQPQTSFHVKKDGVVELIGSGNSAFRNSVQEFLIDKANTSMEMNVMFNTSSLLEFICVYPPMQFLTIYFNQKTPCSFQYENALFDVVVIISTIDEE